MLWNILILGFVSANFINYENVYEFAKMSNNAYYDIASKYWLNTTLDIVENKSIDNHTVKAYLFTNLERDKVVVSFKGTSVYWTNYRSNVLQIDKTKDEYTLITNDLLKDYETCTLSSSANDKYNDNMFFSCCFYKQSNLFKDCGICERLEKTECCSKCYSNTLDYEKNYINVVKMIIDSIRVDYNFDKVDVYFTGHSLGGMLASIASIIYDKPAVTFETPGDIHYIRQSGISNTGSDKIYHFGHNADPIFIGTCGTTCSMVGYNINTKCHSGFTCLYDAKGKLGYTESIFNHRIEYIIKNVISKWENDFPECTNDIMCLDCEGWQFN